MTQPNPPDLYTYRRLPLILWGAAMLCVLSLWLWVSQKQVPYGVLLYGSPHAWIGHTASFRVLVLEANQQRTSTPTRSEGWLVDAHNTRVPSTVLPAHDSHIHTWRIPHNLHPPVRLELRVHAHHTADTLRVPIQLVHTPSSTPKPFFKPYNTSFKNWVFTFETETGRVVSGFQNTLHGRVSPAPQTPTLLTCTQNPVSTWVAPSGVFRFSYTPMPNSSSLTCVLGAQPVYLQIPSHASPLFLQHLPPACTSTSAVLHTRLSGIRPNAVYHIETWVGDVLIDMHTSPEGTLATPLPADTQGWVYTAAHTNPAAPQHSLVALATHIPQQGACPQTSHHAPQTHTVTAPLLLNTWTHHVHTLRAQQTRWHGVLQTAYVVLCAIGAVGLLFQMHTHKKQGVRSATHMMHAWATLAVCAAFAYGIWALLSYFWTQQTF
jgi:hypothetical protein